MTIHNLYIVEDFTEGATLYNTNDTRILYRNMRMNCTDLAAASVSAAHAVKPSHEVPSDVAHWNYREAREEWSQNGSEIWSVQAIGPVKGVLFNSPIGYNRVSNAIPLVSKAKQQRDSEPSGDLQKDCRVARRSYRDTCGRWLTTASSLLWLKGIDHLHSGESEACPGQL